MHRVPHFDGDARGSKDVIGMPPKQVAPSQTVTIIDGSSGARHEVVIGTGDHTDGGSRISPRSR